MNQSQPLRLGVLPPSGGSLGNLERTGQLRRFIDNYLAAYAEGFDEVYYFSYRDEDYDLPKGCTLVPNRTGRSKAYGILLPILQRETLAKCSVLRVMQAPGAHPAILARWLYGIPYAVTFGYDYTGVAKAEGMGPARLAAMRWREWLACRYASVIIQPGPSVRERLSRIAAPGKIVSIPNGVNVDQFKPPEAPSPDACPLFVGRLSRVKNLPLVVRALGGIPGTRFRVIGSGPLEEEILSLGRSAGVIIEHTRSIPNEQLPEELARAGIFIMASVNEGTPKALLEAMASGCACLVNDAPGLRDLIRDGETGLRFDGTEEGCRSKLLLLLRDRELRARLGANARAFVVAHYNLNTEMEREVRLLQALARTGRRRFGVPREAPPF